MTDRAREWHRANRMPKNATLEQRVAWHREHLRHCGCREVPASIRPWLEGTAPLRGGAARPSRRRRDSSR